jgi:undecaprenyl-diphosphatase
LNEINWKTHWSRFSERHLEWVLGAALASLLLGSFFLLTSKLRAGSLLHDIDLILLNGMSELRSPRLTQIAMDMTALGSSTLLGLVSVLILVLLIGVARDRGAAIQMILVSVGAGLWVNMGKQMIERARPEALHAIITSTGYSYPSGHALSSAAIYLTAGLLVGRELSSKPKRWIVMGFAMVLVVLIGLTRVYLGVHYPSDVAAGLLLGMAWAFLVEAGATYYARVVFKNRVP